MAKGSLFGLTPDETFYVKCDARPTQPRGIAPGQVVCEIGVAPVEPEEFVVFRLASSPAAPASSPNSPHATRAPTWREDPCHSTKPRHRSATPSALRSTASSSSRSKR